MQIECKNQLNDNLTDEIKDKIKKTIKMNASPRHVPSKIISILDIPKTKNGKLVEIAVKKTVEKSIISNTIKKDIEEAEKDDLKIVSVINTHEHLDHIGGNDFILKHTGAKLYSHKNAIDKIPGVDIGVEAGDKIKIPMSTKYGENIEHYDGMK